jgi:hypothetical protein
MRRDKPRALVDQSSAFDHALMHARRSWAGGVDGMLDWGPANFDPEPLVIHDLNGEPLFYEFSARQKRTEVGRIKAAASRLVGSGVVTLEQGARRWDPDTAMRVALKHAKKDFPDRRVVGRDFVCYCYPKIGVRLELAGGDEGKNQSVIYDASDGQQVESYDEAGMEGLSAYSFLENLSAEDGAARLKRFDREEEELEAARKLTPRLFERGLATDELKALKAEFTLLSDYIAIPFNSSKVLKYGPRCSPHDCFMLYAQQTSVYCAVATGQMILDFYRRYFEQDDIAAAMGTGAGGTSNTGQVSGYESLSNGCLDATYDNSADWSEAKAEIDANRPLKSGIPGHARACTGWMRQNIWILGTPPKKWLQIHDPWPWNSNICQGGAVYWEDWSAVTHTNFIYLRHNTASHS